MHKSLEETSTTLAGRLRSATTGAAKAVIDISFSHSSWRRMDASASLMVKAAGVLPFDGIAVRRHLHVDHGSGSPDHGADVSPLRDRRERLCVAAARERRRCGAAKNTQIEVLLQLAAARMDVLRAPGARMGDFARPNLAQSCCGPAERAPCRAFAATAKWYWYSCAFLWVIFSSILKMSGTDSGVSGNGF